PPTPPARPVAPPRGRRAQREPYRSGRPSAMAESGRGTPPRRLLLRAVEDLVDDLEGGLGVQEREPGDGLVVPTGRRDECDLVLEEACRPRVVVGGGPARPAEQHHRQLRLAHELEVGELPDAAGGGARECEGVRE